MPETVVEHAVLAEGAQLAADHKERRKLPACANCGFRFEEEPAGADNYCPRCGQENHQLNVSFRYLVLEFLDGAFDFDSKFFRSVKNLLFKPGFLTQQFNAGHRMAYVPPIRLYIFTSFLFFLLVSYQAREESDNSALVKKETVIADSTATENKPGTNIKFGMQGSGKPITLNMPDSVVEVVSKLQTDAQLDSFLKVNSVDPSFASRLALRQALKISKGQTDKFVDQSISNISLLMFFLMPMFGLLLRLAYKSSKRHYVEFLMFALHFHTFVFVLAGLYLLLPDRANSQWLDTLVMVVPVLYLAFALRRVYPQSWSKVTLKTLLVSAVYSAVLFLMLLLTMLVSYALF